MRNLAIDVELVERADEKCLVEHRRQQGVRHPMPGHIDDRNPRRRLAPLQVLDDVGPALLARAGNPCLEVEALLEVDVDDVVAADRAGQRPRAAPDVDARQPGHLARQRKQMAGDVLKVLELAHQVREFIGFVGCVHEENGPWRV